METNRIHLDKTVWGLFVVALFGVLAVELVMNTITHGKNRP